LLEAVEGVSVLALSTKTIRNETCSLDKPSIVLTVEVVKHFQELLKLELGIVILFATHVKFTSVQCHCQHARVVSILG
jgi:hypothetical protein